MLDASIETAPEITLRLPTFGDWLQCGDISRIVRCVPPGADREEAVEFRANELSVARWMSALTGRSQSEIAALPVAIGRGIYLEIADRVPAFGYARADNFPNVVKHLGGHELTLSKPIAAHREDMTKILFRPPTFGDAIAAGDIVVTRVLKSVALNPENPAIEEVLIPEAVGRWFERMSGIAAPILAQLAYRDALAAFAHLRPVIQEISHPNFARP